MLLTFPAIRALGTSLLASAGLAGLIIGMAIKPTLSSLIAGLQIALTEPIRIDDVVIVEGEWGWIEEIGTTYVVVRTWDLRCYVREKLIDFLQNQYPECLPKTRAEIRTLSADSTTPVSADLTPKRSSRPPSILGFPLGVPRP